MRKFSAHFIYTGTGEIIKNGILITENDGTIIDVKNPSENTNDNIDSLEFYNGIIVPGFINAHCHVELSYLKDKIIDINGLVNFIEKLQKEKNKNSNNIIDSIKKADFEMKKNGIVAVGDISNTNNSFQIKKNSSIYYHTFLEIYGIKNHEAKNIIFKGIELKNELDSIGLKGNLSPHSPYSVSVNLYQQIFENLNESAIISIHNQENKSENGLFISKSGELFNFINSENSFIHELNDKFISSIDYLSNFLKNNIKPIFIHNTFTSKLDLEILDKTFENYYLCFCPKSNLFIENTLPNFELFKSHTNKLIIGTDSYASNNTLSILEEMKVIQNNSSFTFDKILNFATINGAKALNIDNNFGSFDVGKKPGINLIQNFDFGKMQLKENSKIKVLL